MIFWSEAPAWERRRLRDNRRTPRHSPSHPGRPQLSNGNPPNTASRHWSSPSTRNPTPAAPSAGQVCPARSRVRPIAAPRHGHIYSAIPIGAHLFSAMAATMASQQLRLSYGSLLPRLSLFSASVHSSRLQLRQLSLPLFPSLRFAIPAISLGLPSVPELLGEIWEGILKAVPKKKVSHMKKRHRQMAGKALKDVTALCKCPACGNLKRMHYLCPHCLKKVQQALKQKHVEDELSSAGS
ncbi:hypothetical protein MAPG_00121 [Magnaporthiopsis poae ATCC 64411]|uniref:Large ribosomal subunit protein bL32m n=1 Tax=Magnaporthiopsis poae (strain ATCC 64411 / 73-15) TaxID=644358 RepID=A0A0C4DK58_MAGP6|nr:hypothetical protein MAPG_00121 [Magnaporthiopsis poae ATCC 64411]